MTKIYSHLTPSNILFLGSMDPFHYHGLTWIPALISNYIHHKVRYEIPYHFLNFNGTAFEV